MKKKLVKQGNSYVLLLDRAVIRLLGWDVTRELRLSLAGDRLTVCPELPPERKGAAEQEEKAVEQLLRKLGI